MVTNLTRASGQPEAQIAKLAYGCGFMVLGEREVEWNLIIIILKKKTQIEPWPKFTPGSCKIFISIGLYCYDLDSYIDFML